MTNALHIRVQGISLIHRFTFLYGDLMSCIFFQLHMVIRVVCSSRHVIVRRIHIRKLLLFHK